MSKATKAIQDVTRRVTLSGLSDLMFDRYAGDNKTTLEAHQKLCFGADGETLVMPAVNISSFLSAQNTPSAPKMLLPVKTYKTVARANLSFTSISPMQIPITRDGKPIKFTGFEGDEDKEAGVYIHRSVARLDKGIPNPKVRPVVRLPWAITFDLTIFPNEVFSEESLCTLFQRGGIAVGLGTYRGVFGKFVVEQWE